ncbi:MAG: glycogen-binding domain-containing protein [Elusimicrobia bacterium]|nr:glycogen-binding domain-containing protein [Elusimicrobiota bacterium]
MKRKVATVFGLFLIFGCAPLPQQNIVGRKPASSISPTAPAGATAAAENGVKFVYNGNAGSVFVAGSFNNWSQTANPLKMAKPGVWETTVKLSPGAYQYKFVVDGNWVPDPNNPNTSDDGYGGVNSVVTVAAAAPSGGKSVSSASAPVKVAGGVLFTCGESNAGSVYVAGSFNNWSTTANPMVKSKNGIWTATIPLSPGRYQYKFVVDGNWVPDPNNPNTSDDGYGGVNSVVTVQ